MFKQYLTIIRTAWLGQLTYRLNFLGYRLGNFTQISAQIVIWSAVFRGTDVVSGYSYREMITYIIMGWLFSFVTSNYGIEYNVSDDIRLGRLSNFLVKPISYLRYITTLSIGRISIALISSVVMQVLFILIFINEIIPVSSWYNLMIILAMVVVGYFIKLFFSVLVGLLSFWTIEISGLYYLYNISISFLSGAYFPLNLLPGLLVNISLAFPFVYTFYVPAQLYLGKITPAEGLRGLLIEILWLFALYGIIKIVWRFGLKKYESVGI